MNPETKIQSQITDTLKDLGFYVIRLVLAQPNGCPDLIAIRNGKTVFVEVKQPGEKARKLQKYRHKQISDQGIPVLTVSSSEEIKRTLT